MIYDRTEVITKIIIAILHSRGHLTCWNVSYWPWHGRLLQGERSKLLPAQGLPPYLGAGLLHERNLRFVPLPHVVVQVPNIPHDPHAPSTKPDGYFLHVTVFVFVHSTLSKDFLLQTKFLCSSYQDAFLFFFSRDNLFAFSSILSVKTRNSHVHPHSEWSHRWFIYSVLSLNLLFIESYI